MLCNNLDYYIGLIIFQGTGDISLNSYRNLIEYIIALFLCKLFILIQIKFYINNTPYLN